MSIGNNLKISKRKVNYYDYKSHFANMAYGNIVHNPIIFKEKRDFVVLKTDFYYSAHFYHQFKTYDPKR